MKLNTFKLSILAYFMPKTISIKISIDVEKYYYF